MGYAVVCMDSAGFVNSPAAARGLYPIGGRKVIRTNFSKKSIQITGAIGEGKADIQFSDSVNTDNTIAMLKQIHRKRGKTFVILDNASPHRSGRVKEYVESTNGDIVLWYLLPHLPTHNPIEIFWRDLKRAIKSRYYEGGFKQMRKSIGRLVRDGEVKVTKLFQYMLDAIEIGKASTA